MPPRRNLSAAKLVRQPQIICGESDSDSRNLSAAKAIATAAKGASQNDFSDYPFFFLSLVL
ncbi:hypothetical protein [Ureibacillus thermosphaericus]|uniref:hypothetical protein n=1 Tax=Ureibacillus thermosphaericus TaxID=51173 RepID=UPI0030C9615D